MTISWEIGELENGLRVVTTPVATAQSVSVNVFVGAGSRGEERRTNGLCHYIEHMMFKGTEKRPNAIVIAEAIEGAGGVLNAFTAKEFTCYWNHVPYDRLGLAMEVLADMLQHSLLDPKEIERERSVVQQEIRRVYDQPAAWASELLSRVCFGDQPIGWPVIGTEESVAGLAREDFVEHLQNWYVPSNIVLSVAGNTTHADVMRAARDLFGGLPERTAPTFQLADGDLPDERIIVEKRDIAQCNLGIALRAIARKDPDRYILLVLNSVLGRGMSSRLFKEVRERRGLAYSVGSAVTRYHDTGAVSVSAGVSPEKLTEATAVIRDELLKLTEEPVGPEEMTKARDYTVGSFRLSLETPMALAQRAGESLLTVGEIEPIEEVVARLETVSAEEIQRVAARIFRRDNLALAVVGPTSNADELGALLSA